MLSLAHFLLFFLILIPTVVAAEIPREHLELQERWRRGTLDDDLIFGALGRVLTDESGNVYAVDSQLSEILILSPEGEFLRTISGPGEGPGEVNQPADLYYGLGGKVGLLQAFPGKIVQLMPDGTPLDNFRMPETPGGGFQVVLRAMALDDRLILAGQYNVTGDGGSTLQRKYLKAVAPDGSVLTTFHQQDDPFQWGGMKYVEERFTGFNTRWVAFDDGRVAAPLAFHDYAIHLWAPDGELLKVIERPDYEPVERTDEERETTQALFDAIITFNPRSTFEIADQHAAVSQMFAQPDGELWVLSGRGLYRRPEGSAAVFDVFDSEGTLVRQVEIAGDLDPEQDGLFLDGDRLFAVTGALGAAMSAMGGGDAGDDDFDVEPSNLVCFDLVPVD